jgi:hypothetical protein
MSELNQQSLQMSANAVKRSSDIINKLVTDTVSYYCKDLDELVKSVSELISDNNTDLTIQELESIALKIPTFLYFISSEQEYVGVKFDISKLNKNDKYSKIYLAQQGTNNVRDAVANSECFSETMISIVNMRAYKIIDAKVTAAYELLNSVKKIIIRKTDTMKRGEE